MYEGSKVQLSAILRKILFPSANGLFDVFRVPRKPYNNLDTSLCLVSARIMALTCTTGSLRPDTIPKLLLSFSGSLVVLAAPD